VRAVATDGAGRTLRYELAGTLLVLVHGARSPSDVDWDDYVLALGASRVTGLLVATDGAGPDGRQRVKLNDLVKQRGGSFPTAVVTGSVVARGIVTALGWFNPKLRAFAPAEIADALVYLGADPHRRDDLARRITRMRTALATAEAGVY
jgi:hypothetical protein